MRTVTAIPVISSATAGAFNESDNPGVENDIQGISEPSGLSLSSIIASLLRLSTNALQICILPFSVLLDSVNPGALFAGHAAFSLSAFTSAGGTVKTITLKPSVDQTGKVLAFEVDGTPTSGVDTGLLAAVHDLIDATPPRYAAGNLASRIVANMPALASGTRCAVVVDQTNGKIQVITYTNAAAEAVFKTALEAGTDGLELKFPMPVLPDAPSAGDPSLVFEGGPTS